MSRRGRSGGGRRRPGRAETKRKAFFDQVRKDGFITATASVRADPCLIAEGVANESPRDVWEAWLCSIARARRIRPRSVPHSVATMRQAPEWTEAALEAWEWLLQLPFQDRLAAMTRRNEVLVENLLVMLKSCSGAAGGAGGAGGGTSSVLQDGLVIVAFENNAECTSRGAALVHCFRPWEDLFDGKGEAFLRARAQLNEASRELVDAVRLCDSSSPASTDASFSGPGTAHNTSMARTAAATANANAAANTSGGGRSHAISDASADGGELDVLTLSPTIGGDDDLLALIVRNGGEFGSIPIQMRNEDGPRGQVDVVEFAVFTLGGFIANHLLLCVQEAFGQREEYEEGGGGEGGEGGGRASPVSGGSGTGPHHGRHGSHGSHGSAADSGGGGGWDMSGTSADEGPSPFTSPSRGGGKRQKVKSIYYSVY